MARGRRELVGRFVTMACAACALAGCEGRAPEGGPLDVRVSFGEVGSDPGQFSYPRCLDHDQASLWVIDKLARVQRLNPVTGECLGGWRMPEWENGKPTGITVWAPPAGGKARVFIPDTHYHRVMIYDPEGAAPPARALESRGKLLASFGKYGEGDGEFIYLTDVAVLPTPDGKGIARLYVSEYGGHDRISVFEPAPGQAPNEETAFEFKFSFGRFGDGDQAEPVEFNRPQSMEIDGAARELVVTDACNHRIGRFTLEGKLVKWIGGRAHAGKAAGEMSYPYGLALLGDGTAIVAEFGNNRVQRFDLATGQGLGIFGEPGRLRGQLASPWGVSVFGREVYVLDSGNNRVQSFARPPAHRHATDAPSPVGGHG